MYRHSKVGHFTFWTKFKCGITLQNGKNGNRFKQGEATSVIEFVSVFTCKVELSRTEALVYASNCQVHYHFIRALAHYCTATFCPHECVMWIHLSPL